MSSHALDTQLPERLLNQIAEMEKQIRELRTLQLNSANALDIVGTPADPMQIDSVLAAGEEANYNFQIFPAGNLLTNWDLYFTVYVDLPSTTLDNDYRYPSGPSLSSGQKLMSVSTWPDWGRSFDSTGMRWINVNIRNNDSVSHHVYVAGKFYGPYALQEEST